MSLHAIMVTIGEQAKKAANILSGLSTEEKNSILLTMANTLDSDRDLIKKANQLDVAAAEKAQLSPALIDRLRLTDARIDEIIRGFKQVITLPDPIGRTLHEYRHPSGLLIKKTCVPLGVIGIIYESRPNVTADVVALCLKTANAVILRGGSEAYYSNIAIAESLVKACQTTALPEDAIQFIATTDRTAVQELVQLEGLVDLIIPRGGESLIKTVMSLAKVPVIKHDKGLCTIYVDQSANIPDALAICENAKCQRPSACNAAETLLVHQAIAHEFLPQLFEQLSCRGVECRGDERALQIVPQMKKASSADWDTEYLDLIVAIKIVDSVDQAIEHINQHGSHHSDAIVSQSLQAQQLFSQQVDSAAVYINASTRFTDGGEYGMGAEIGISTEKLHARGPMGLEELTTYKYIGFGHGQVRASNSS